MVARGERESHGLVDKNHASPARRILLAFTRGRSTAPSTRLRRFKVVAPRRSAAGPAPTESNPATVNWTAPEKMRSELSIVARGPIKGRAMLP
jgi:hypothetical protein